MAHDKGMKVDRDGRVVRVCVDLDLHSREAVFGAAYTFIDRCYVWLDKGAGGELVVELRPREEDDTSLESLGGDFGNELLAQSVRALVQAENGELVQAIVRRALIGAGAGGDVSSSAAMDLDELAGLDLDDEPFDDPLGIAMSWEQKYGKKSPTEETGK
jgi:His-Xaa-Ser system protein HxsD